MVSFTDITSENQLFPQNRRKKHGIKMKDNPPYITILKSCILERKVEH
jgi:hypothetical protein